MQQEFSRHIKEAQDLVKRVAMGTNTSPRDLCWAMALAVSLNALSADSSANANANVENTATESYAW